jgi:hypothetical protein
LVAARQIAVGDCVQTVSGREQVVSVNKVDGQGIYTIIAMEELIVVNGIVATPFGGVNPTLANSTTTCTVWRTPTVCTLYWVRATGCTQPLLPSTTTLPHCRREMHCGSALKW